MGKDFYNKLLELLQGFYIYSTKTNKYVNKYIVTGITEIAKGNIYSGMNHFIMFGLLEENFSAHVGFTEKEVSALLEINLNEKADEEKNKYKEYIREWYNGYNIGGLTIYNPWSISKYLEFKKLNAYWLNSSSNQLLKNQLKIIANNTVLMSQLKKLLSGETITLINLRKYVEEENEPILYDIKLFCWLFNNC